MKLLPSDSVSAVVTDPPYELGFMGKKWDSSGIAYDINVWKEVLRVLKPGGHLLSFGGTRTYHRMACAIEDAGFEIRDCIQYLYGSGFPKSMNISKAIDKKFVAEREVIGISNKQPSGYIRHGRTDEEVFYGNDNHRTQEIITSPSTIQAKQWDGWGTCLKPANEPIVLARKPLECKTVIDNVLKFGTGGINIDGSRILSADMPNEFHRGVKGKVNVYAEYNADCHYTPNDKGRFPSNVILDETAAVMLDEQTGVTKSNPNLRKNVHNKVNLYGSHGSYISTGYSDIGGASRFFYCAKASKKERNMGCINNHPTVKPIKLMEYLVKLITPPNGTVLDPFMGSGSTCIAAHNLGFPYVGIEENEDYYKIAKERIDANATSVQ